MFRGHYSVHVGPHVELTMEVFILYIDTGCRYKTQG